MMENSEMINDMDKEHLNGKMERYTKGLGQAENNMEKVFSSVLME
jgi:hypothetical protein